MCISRQANDQIRDKLALAFADQGEQAVKNLARAIGVFGLGAADIAALPEPDLPAAERPSAPWPPAEQDIRFCTSADGVRLAYASIGSGPPLVRGNCCCSPGRLLQRGTVCGSSTIAAERVAARADW